MRQNWQNVPLESYLSFRRLADQKVSRQAKMLKLIKDAERLRGKVK
jgi:hypothetical protein